MRRKTLPSQDTLRVGENGVPIHLPKRSQIAGMTSCDGVRHLVIRQSPIYPMGHKDCCMTTIIINSSTALPIADMSVFAVSVIIKRSDETF